jgi:thymine-DNA glycosylase
MTQPASGVQGERGQSIEATPDYIQGEGSFENESTESLRPKANFKARIGLYAYWPVKPTEASPGKMSSGPDDPVAPNRGKRGADSTPISVSTRSKRRATSTSVCASISPGPSTVSTKSAKHSSTRGARRFKDPYSPVNNLVDSIRPGLMLLMIGLNPGLMTAETGHAYAHPSNHFWKLMHSSGLTDRRHLPSETRDLMDLYSIGNTNLCVRPTRDGAGLSKDELEAGVPVLEEKVRAYRPEVVCIVGKGIWETIVRVKVRNGAKKQAKNVFNYGWQDERLWLGREVDKYGNVVWVGARTFVATTTSGLAASTTPAEKAAIWKELGDWIIAKRAEDMVKVEEGMVKVEEDMVKVEEDMVKVEEDMVKAEENMVKVEEDMVKAEEDKVKVEEDMVKVKEDMVKVEEVKVKVEEVKVKVEEVKVKVEEVKVKVEEVKVKVEEDKVKVEEVKVKAEEDKVKVREDKVKAEEDARADVKVKAEDVVAEVPP